MSMEAKCHCGKIHEGQPKNFDCECGRPMFVDMFKETDGEDRKEQCYFFVNYYKYCFRLRLEDGTDITNEGDSDEIYRLGINQTGIAKPYENDAWLVDGVVFK